MRPNIHPAYGPVVYQDQSTGDRFLTRSTASSRETTVWTDGNTYPLVTIDVTAYSHPFWTGGARVLDAAGQVEKFNRRYGKRRA
ncbi:type B 50S ribosomal protein L31 [Pseudonocardia sp. KRD-184]|uniref:Large ribosomal subunit protein bL31B n=1 Tax=Pseudonocardia oceani TaxID=2792013 RepID=A0ABS6U3I3_9PSEU|nr:type B 50S ribosomal protein L31 [Pseudonocardia oceani]MBW0092004.1 type B 50S ribosomal protein L31 [Pseudonocardia oceani]MBW0099603.1 type B 50S ribosomal protein L31 [Pseudonocardia oceani]MBW0112338.1 type B 50S ribosomal protein L31 [Pseudonocardia oceani]MBW0123954.1 type B 50S ribosomal protein L31 [Pseudonocardia oceani]MBW0126789.1 type B 50S ribosomal protein L31 [Pseudonocardia oceani]